MRKLALWFCAGVLAMAGCRTAPTAAPDAGDPAAMQANADLARGYALLYQLVNDESGLSQILILKSVTPKTKLLIDEITDSSKRAEKHLKAIPRRDPGMPKAEVDTRASISSATGMRLLGAGNDRFEVELLLTQTSATEYGSNMATVLAKMETRPDEKAWLQAFAKEYWAFNRRAAALLNVASPEKPK